MPCDPCSTAQRINTPTGGAACQPGPRGEKGDSGSAGSAGSNGDHAFTLTTDAFAVPAVGASVSVQVGNGSWIGAGQIVYVEGAGYFSASSPAASSVTLTNLGYGPNAAEATNIEAGAIVSPGGAKGANAPDDTLGYILLRRELAAGTDNGTLTAGSWTARILNTTVNDTKGQIVTLDTGTGIFTLKAGKYRIRAEAPCFDVSRHRSRIRNITSGGSEIYGTSEFSGDNGQTSSLVIGELNLLVDTELVLESRCQTTKAATGRGVAADFAATEVYEFVEIRERN
jgi:hypothetical protein